MSATEEEWRPVVGHEPRWMIRYEVSDHGRVRNAATGRYLSLGDVAYPRVVLTGPSSTYGWYAVHTLILIAFVGPCPDGWCCRHLDGNPRNNMLSNLCWGTVQENMDDRERHGRTARGERAGSRKLSAIQVDEIRRRVRAGETQAAVGRSFGVHQAHVSLIVNGKAWARLSGR